jgi:hypothetical protein
MDLYCGLAYLTAQGSLKSDRARMKDDKHCDCEV